MIKKIKVRYSGAQTTGVGLAFDNFTPSSPGLNPVPTINSWGIAILSLLVAGLAIGVMRRREAQGSV